METVWSDIDRSLQIPLLTFLPRCLALMSHLNLSSDTAHIFGMAQIGQDSSLKNALDTADNFRPLPFLFDHKKKI